jgi:hypothetical protein
MAYQHFHFETIYSAANRDRISIHRHATDLPDIFTAWWVITTPPLIPADHKKV